MTYTFDDLIGPLLAAEGGYVNDPKDSGGETNWGVTIGTARANGYKGSMKAMTKADAVSIYKKAHWVGPGYSDVANLSFPVAAELFDCGVNMGIGAAGVFFQRLLNVLNRNGQDYRDIGVDGDVGPATMVAFEAFMKRRGPQGTLIMVKAIKFLRGARYIALAEARVKDEAFVFGWLNRISP